MLTAPLAPTNKGHSFLARMVWRRETSTPSRHTDQFAIQVCQTYSWTFVSTKLINACLISQLTHPSHSNKATESWMHRDWNTQMVREVQNLTQTYRIPETARHRIECTCIEKLRVVRAGPKTGKLAHANGISEDENNLTSHNNWWCSACPRTMLDARRDRDPNWHWCTQARYSEVSYIKLVSRCSRAHEISRLCNILASCNDT